MRLHDIGLQIVRNEAGELGFKVYVGGGMGRTPMIAPLIRDFVPTDDLLSYLEACLRVYNRYGRRDNIYKARIKILVHEIGADEYRRQVEEEFAPCEDAGHRSAAGRVRADRRLLRAARVRAGPVRRARPHRPRFRAVGRPERRRAQAARLCDRHDQPEADRRHPRRRHRRADGR